jgi:hypothetical protein
MSTFERRVSELLRGYGEGLEMTTQDVNRLEQELEQKRAAKQAQSRGRRNRIFQAAVAACALIGVALGAMAVRSKPDPTPQPASPGPVTLEQLEGIWRVDGSPWLWRFTADGHLVQSEKPDLLTRAVPRDAPVARPAPGGFIMSDPAFPGCDARWTATISAEGHLQATEPAETKACPGEDGIASPASSWDLTRLSPASPAGRASTSTFLPIAPVEVTIENQDAYLGGTWLLRGTGTLLTLVQNKYPQDVHLFQYALQDLGTNAAPRTGTARARLNGQVLFWPPDGTGSCTVEYESVISRGRTLEAKLAASSCDRFGGVNDTWVRLN